MIPLFLKGKPQPEYQTSLNLFRLPSGYLKFSGQWKSDQPAKLSMTAMVKRLMDRHGAEVQRLWLDANGNVVKQNDPTKVRKLWKCHVPKVGNFTNWMSDLQIDGKPKWWIDLKSCRIMPGSELQRMPSGEDAIPSGSILTADLEMIYAAWEFCQIWDAGEGWLDPLSIRDISSACWRKSRKQLEERGANSAYIFIAARAYGLFNVTVGVASATAKRMEPIRALRMFSQMHKSMSGFNELGGNFWARSRAVAYSASPWYSPHHGDLAMPRVAWEAYGIDTQWIEPCNETGYSLWPGYFEP